MEFRITGGLEDATDNEMAESHALLFIVEGNAMLLKSFR